MEALEKKLIQCRMFLMKHSPFFATLLLNSRVNFSESIPTFATDGQSLLVNPGFLESLTIPQATGVLCHEVLHMAFSHVLRTKDLPAPDNQEKYIFANYAADIIVNGVVRKVPVMELPDGAIIDEDLEDLSFPEVYSIIKSKPPFDIQEVNVCFGQGDGESEENDKSDKENLTKESEKWEDLLEQAKTVELQAGDKNGILTKLQRIENNSNTDYRSVLARYIINSNSSWGGYDRRFIYDGFYIDDLLSEELNLRVYIDSSGSVEPDLLAAFLSEIEDNLALSRWAKVNYELYTFCTEINEKVPYSNGDDLLEGLHAGGGTDFYAVMEHLNSTESFEGKTVTIIYTDGHARIPEPQPDVIWFLGGSYARQISDFISAGWEDVYRVLD